MRLFTLNPKPFRRQRPSLAVIAPWSLAFLVLAPAVSVAAETETASLDVSPQRYVAEASAPAVDLPEGQRPPAGWRVLAIPGEGTDAALELRWEEQEAGAADLENGALLRITIGLDQREPARATARVIGGKILGEFDTRYASTHQPFELALTPAQARAALEHGVALQQTEGAAPIFILDGRADGPVAAPPAQAPHLLTVQAGDRTAALRSGLASLDTLQPFGWMEQCLIDGLGDLGEDAAVRERLAMYVDEAGVLDYEDPRSRPVSSRVYGIEGSGMFARVATHMPGSPALDTVKAFWTDRRDDEGCVIDGTITSAEGCYTVAYPMAVLAREQEAPEWADEAIRQLRLRRDRLVHDGALWLRHHAGDPPDHSFRNWARGVTWYLLGWVRTMREVSDRDRDLTELETELRRAAGWAMEHQRPDGLWAVYVDEPDLAADTAASAGIAAALAIGHAEGWLNGAAREAAERTHTALLEYLAPDGLLRGGAQSNKGGEALQRSDYRVMLMPGTGLMAQLIAALEAD